MSKTEKIPGKEMGIGEAMKTYEKMFDAQVGISSGEITKLFFTQMQDIKQNFSILGLEMKTLKEEKVALVERVNELTREKEELEKKLGIPSTPEPEPEPAPTPQTS